MFLACFEKMPVWFLEWDMYSLSSLTFAFSTCRLSMQMSPPVWHCSCANVSSPFISDHHAPLLHLFLIPCFDFSWKNWALSKTFDSPIVFFLSDLGGRDFDSFCSVPTGWALACETLSRYPDIVNRRESILKHILHLCEISDYKNSFRANQRDGSTVKSTCYSPLTSNTCLYFLFTTFHCA